MQENITKFLSIDKTLASDIFFGCKYPHEALGKIKDYVYKLGERLNSDLFYSTDDGIWIAKSARVSPTATIVAPCIIDENAEIRQCAFIRGSAIIGKNAVVGNSTELKNVILFDNVQVPHYNYVGDSILGYKAHMGASAITSNVKMDKNTVYIDYGDGRFDSALKKLGAVIGDNVEVGCGAVLNPGSVIGKCSRIYPLSAVRGYVEENTVYKSYGNTERIDGR